MMMQFGLPVRCLDVIDGDTLKATVILDEYIRLAGIDAPEKSQPDQREAAEVVELAVKAWIKRQDYISINPTDYDKYGHRLVCVVSGSEERDLASWLKVEGLVHYYDGKTKLPWGKSELKRIAERWAEFSV